MASKFNAEAYRREAKALGLTDEQIESDIAEEMGGDQGQFSEPTAESVDLNKDKVIPGWLQPAAIVTGIGAAAGAGKSIYDRYMRSRELDPFKIEPKMDVNQKPADGRIEPVWDPKQIVNQVNAEQMPVQAEAQQMGQKATEKAVTTGGVPPKGGGKISPTDMGMVASSEQAKVEKEITKQGIKPPSAGPVKPEIDVTGLTKEQAAMKRWLVSQYGGGPEGLAAYDQVVKIVGEAPSYPKGQGGGLSPEHTAAVKAWRKENIAGPKINLTHDMTKAFKSGAGLAVLAAIPGFAEAAQQKNVGKAADVLSDLFVLPFAQSGTAGMPKSQEEALLAEKFAQAQKLGSPYRSVPPKR